MRSFSILNRRAGAVLTAVALVFATMVPALVSAATVTTRSIELSSSVKSAIDVEYKVKFTAATNATGAFVLDFCTTPTIGAACTAPAGFDATDVASADATVSDVDANTVKVVLTAPVDADDPIDADGIVLTDMVNPSAKGPFYARIVTYTDGTTNYGYVDAENLDTATTKPFKDTGGVAMNITDGFGVSGAVLETMTFCASNATIADDCVTTTTPNVSLGAGGVLTTALATGTVYTKISTNAVGGAIVSLKSNAAGCGGLVRAGADDNAAGCGITPLTVAGAINSNDAKYGVTLAATGVTLEGNYDASDYYMGYAVGDTSGITGPYGDPIYSAAGPVNQATANLTFGANISNVTPAGNYSAALNLIATGKF